MKTVLQLLAKGQWHHIKDVSKRTNLTNTTSEGLTEFLAKHNFVQIRDS
jgi:DNA-binding IclR family transcriptional regulator